MASDALNMRQEVVSLCDQVARFGFRIMDYDGASPRPGKDDDLVITMLRTNAEIQTYFRHTGHLLPNQTSGNLRIEVDCSTLAYYDWITNVKESDLSANAALHLGGLTGGKDKDLKRAGKKVAYHVECKEADLDEICQDWQTASQWTVEYDQSLAEANQLMEPEVIFKLSRIFATIIIIISNENVHDIPSERTSDIFEEVYFSATERYEDNYLERLTSAPRIETRTCEREKKQIVKEYAEIRPLVRLFRRSSPDRRETKPSEPSFNWRQYVSTETRRPSIKFSTSTALYTPPKPSYDNIRSSGSPNPRETHPRERAGGRARAKTEFGDRSFTSRRYISLYN